MEQQESSQHNNLGTGCELEDELPENEYREYFAPDYRLHIPLRSDVENLNTREYLDQLKRKLFANIARCAAAPECFTASSACRSSRLSRAPFLGSPHAGLAQPTGCPSTSGRRMR